MANTIKVKQSSVAAKVPTTAQLALGELAVNTTDGKLFLKKSVSGTESIVEVGGLSAGTVTSVTATAPISVATGTTTPAISISAATTSAAGSMSAADKTKLDAVSGSNAGDETTATIKTKLGISTLSGANTGDQTLPTLASLGAQAAGTYATGTGTASGTNTGDQTLPVASSTAPAALGTAAVGTGTTFARADHVHLLPSLATLGAQAAGSYQAAGTYATGTGTASGTNTGDETLATIKTKLSITTLSGANTGDQTLPTLASLGAQAAGTYATGTGTASGTNTGDQTLPAASSTAPAALGTSAVGTGTTFARADHVHLLPSLATLGAQAAGSYQAAGTYATGTGTASGTNTGDETLATIKTKLSITTLSGSNTGDQTLPTTLPASDVYAWAKAATKPSYTASEVGLGSVNNTADSAKSVSYAATAGSASNATTAGGLAVATGTNNAANQIVRTDANGYIQAGYINSSNGNENNSANADRVWGTNGSDNYLRTYRTSALSVSYAATAGSAPASGGTSAACSGNAATATKAEGAINWWSTSHPVNYYCVNNWDGTYWSITSNHGALVKVGYATSAGTAGSAAANDVYSWAKSSSKPSYAQNEISSAALNATTGTFSGAITSAGNITAYYSDDRLKTRLGSIENALDKVDTLDTFYYQANELAQSLGYEPVREVGLSAQQVQSVMPEVVAPAPVDPEYLTIRYERLLALAFAAIKEMRAEIRSLQ